MLLAITCQVATQAHACSSSVHQRDMWQEGSNSLRRCPKSTKHYNPQDSTESSPSFARVGPCISRIGASSRCLSNVLDSLLQEHCKNSMTKNDTKCEWSKEVPPRRDAICVLPRRPTHTASKRQKKLRYCNKHIPAKNEPPQRQKSPRQATHHWRPMFQSGHSAIGAAACICRIIQTCN